MFPTHTLHDLFANHEDTDFDFCAKYHSHLGTHIEKKHTHCEILKTITPVYDAPTLLLIKKIESVDISEITINQPSAYFSHKYPNLPSRAPPMV